MSVSDDEFDNEDNQDYDDNEVLKNIVIKFFSSDESMKQLRIHHVKEGK